MNIYEYAMQMELDGEKYYRELAEQSKTEGITRIFAMLADEEVKHYRVVEKLSRHRDAPEMAETEILDNVKNVFANMSETGQPLHVDTTRETQDYRKARDIEEQSVVFYQDKAVQADNELHRQIFLRLAEEEKKHLRIMENLVEFVSRPEPGNWLENAEWHHLDNY